MPRSIDCERAKRYGAATVWLKTNLADTLAPAVFSMALTNGLLTIASAINLGGLAQQDPTERTPSPTTLLNQFKKLGDGGEVITLPADDTTVFDTVIDCGRLLHVVATIDPVRHGRTADQGLMEDDLAALVALDRHPSLQIVHRMADEEYDVLGAAEDEAESSRAWDYLMLLGDDELRRADTVPRAQVNPGDWAPPEPSECPVCGHSAIISNGDDAYGYGITEGTCFVCSYHRGTYATASANLELEWERHADD